MICSATVLAASPRTWGLKSSWESSSVLYSATGPACQAARWVHIQSLHWINQMCSQAPRTHLGDRTGPQGQEWTEHPAEAGCSSGRKVASSTLFSIYLSQTKALGNQVCRKWLRIWQVPLPAFDTDCQSRGGTIGSSSTSDCREADHCWWPPGYKAAPVQGQHFAIFFILNTQNFSTRM